MKLNEFSLIPVYIVVDNGSHQVRMGSANPIAAVANIMKYAPMASSLTLVSI
jgi:hypothetical protein